MARTKPDDIPRASESTPLIEPDHDHYDDIRAWAYPLTGVIYLFTHPPLFRPLTSRLILSLFISIAIIWFMFFFTYLPQVALLAIFVVHGPLVFLNAALMVLSEAATLISFVLENFVLEEPLVDVFDAVLVQEGFEGLVGVGREVLPAEGKDIVARLGKFKKSPFVRFSCWLLIEWAFEFPLNFIPVFGVPLFLVLQGYRAGPIAHYHYFQLLNFKKKERKQLLRRKWWAYLSFGTVSLVVQIFPIASTFFCFTNAIGAAQWAVRIERSKEVRRTAAMVGGGIV